MPMLFSTALPWSKWKTFRQHSRICFQPRCDRMSRSHRTIPNRGHFGELSNALDVDYNSATGGVLEALNHIRSFNVFFQENFADIVRGQKCVSHCFSCYSDEISGQCLCDTIANWKVCLTVVNCLHKGIPVSISKSNSIQQCLLRYSGWSPTLTLALLAYFM